MSLGNFFSREAAEKRYYLHTRPRMGLAEISLMITAEEHTELHQIRKQIASTHVGFFLQFQLRQVSCYRE
jgi:hypothetical protein